MQAFGIELRKKDTVKSLYQDVDIILRKNDILPGEISHKMQVQTAAHSLQKMFRSDGYCDVCTIQNAASVCQISISTERITMYRTVHCIHWNEMLADYRDALIASILDDFRTILYADAKSVEEIITK